MAHNASGGFTDVEFAAIKERAAELRAEKGGKQNAEGKVVVFDHSAAKYGTRYNTLRDAALIDDGVMWPTSYAITGPLGAAEEKQIAQLVRRASGSADSGPKV